MENEKYRLIRFKQREQDNLRTEGGGKETFYPWTLDGEELKKHSETLIQQVQQLDQKTKPNIPDFPYILKVSILDEAKAKSHQSKLISMFNVDSTPSQLGMISENQLLLKLDKDVSLTLASENMGKLNQNQNSISAITEIKEFEPAIIVDEEESIYKINFIDFHDEKLNNDVLEYVEKKLSDNDIKFERKGYSSTHKVLEVSDITLDKLTFIKKLPVKNIEPMPSIEFPFLDTNLTNEYTNGFIQYEETGKYPIVGLLDSGVTILSQLEGFVRRGNGCNYDEEKLNTNHGTFIANLLVHGNQMNNVNDYSIDGCIIIDVPIVPNYPIREPELIANIKKAICSNPEIKIWNLSVSIKGTKPDENLFSDFAIALDKIQDEYNVLICKSAGNDEGSYILGEEPKKISLGADSVRSLTVGSIARSTDIHGFSKENSPSPYSRVGRGPAQIIKPDVVHYGGDIYSLSPLPTSIEDFETKGERSIVADGTERIEPGTSFSTPKIAKLLAELYLVLNMSSQNFDPLLLKAMVIHSANYLDKSSISDAERLKRLGYGKPNNSKELVNQDSPHTVTLMLAGKLKKKERIDIMDFPYPKNLVENGSFIGELKVTLVYSNYISEEMGPEYCQSDMILRLGTYDKLVDRDTSKRTILNPIGRSDSKNMLVKNIYGKNKIKRNVEFLRERNLIEYGDKYYPIKKFSADLKEVKDSVQMKNLSGDKKWFLYLEGLYRDFIYQRVNQDDSQLSMDYTLLITISDPTKSIDIYSETIRELELHNFEYNTIDVDSQIEIDSESILF